jgi:hypothetical protein
MAQLVGDTAAGWPPILCYFVGHVTLLVCGLPV